MIIKDNNGYLVRNAVRCYFDRWANSGCEFHVQNEDEVIKYFSDNLKCVVGAITELAEAIVEECGFNNDNANINKTIDFMYSLLES